jgi:hypothetical protein
MWKNILIIGLLITISSCGSKKNAVETSNEIITYKSLGNDIGDVNLYFKKNGTFQLSFRSVEAPVGEDKPVKVVYKGNFTSNKNDAWKTLTFTHPDFVANGVFDTSKEKGVQIINQKVVKINTDKKTLSIWELVCEKQ